MTGESIIDRFLLQGYISFPPMTDAFLVDAWCECNCYQFIIRGFYVSNKAPDILGAQINHVPFQNIKGFVKSVLPLYLTHCAYITQTHCLDHICKFIILHCYITHTCLSFSWRFSAFNFFREVSMSSLPSSPYTQISTLFIRIKIMDVCTNAEYIFIQYKGSTREGLTCI